MPATYEPVEPGVTVTPVYEEPKPRPKPPRTYPYTKVRDPATNSVIIVPSVPERRTRTTGGNVE